MAFSQCRLCHYSELHWRYSVDRQFTSTWHSVDTDHIQWQYHSIHTDHLPWHDTTFYSPKQLTLTWQHSIHPNNLH